MTSKGPIRELYVLASDSQLHCESEQKRLLPNIRKFLLNDSKFFEVQIASGAKRGRTLPCAGKSFRNPATSRGMNNIICMKMQLPQKGMVEARERAFESVRNSRSATGVRQRRNPVSSFSDIGVIVSHMDCPVPLQRKLATINLTTCETAH